MTAVIVLGTEVTTSWLLHGLLTSIVLGAATTGEVLDTVISVVGLINFSIFTTYFFSPLKVSLQGTSSPPWIRSLEYHRLPVTVH